MRKLPKFEGKEGVGERETGEGEREYGSTIAA